jgi:hypothetical protein
LVDKEWLLQRATAYGPEVVHQSEIVDPDIEKYGTKKREVNKRTYYEYTRHSKEVNKIIRSRKDFTETRPALAEIRLAADVVLLTHDNDQTKVVLLKRQNPPSEGTYVLPGAFLWDQETAMDAAGP